MSPLAALPGESQWFPPFPVLWPFLPMSDDTLIPRAPAHPAVTLSAFAETIIRGRRVAVLGDATTSLPSRLIERGARVVHVFDPDAGRVAVAAAASREPTQPVATLWAEDLGVRDGAFDVVVVPDLSLFEDGEEVVRRVRRLVSQNGVALLASPNPDATKFLLPPAQGLHRALGYYELFDAVSLQFPEVKMLGQAPFVGYALVDFSEPEPEISVDTSLLDEPEVPEWYVAVASDRAVEIESFALVEIALADVGRLALAEPITLPPIRPTGPTEEEVALTAAQARIAVLLTENEKLREQVADLGRAERAFENASLRAAELERDGASLKTRAAEVEALRDEEQRRGDALAADVARLTADLRAQQKINADLSSAAAQVRDNEPTLILDRTLTDAKRRISDLEAQIAGMDPPTLRSKEMQAQRILALENQKTALESQKAALESQKAALEERERTLIATNKKHELEKAGLVGRHAAAEARARELAEELAVMKESPSPSDEALAAQEAVRNQALALEEEVRRLEQSLRDRGREIAKLTRDLRQTERVGRELLSELELAKAASSSSSGSGGAGGSAVSGGNGGGSASHAAGPGGALAVELDADVQANAERLARVEADLYAAGWQIARLERELAEAKPEAGQQRDPAHDLSVALAAAQREIASLRLRGFDHTIPGSAVARAEILEQSVLMSQVEAGRGLDRR
jgi:SAM-dependent methyltransferase